MPSVTRRDVLRREEARGDEQDTTTPEVLARDILRFDADFGVRTACRSVASSADDWEVGAESAGSWVSGTPGDTDRKGEGEGGRDVATVAAVRVRNGGDDCGGDDTAIVGAAGEVTRSKSSSSNATPPIGGLEARTLETKGEGDPGAGGEDTTFRGPTSSPSSTSMPLAGTALLLAIPATGWELSHTRSTAIT